MKDLFTARKSDDNNKDVTSSTAFFRLDSIYGSVRPSQSPEDFDEICRVAKDDKAERTVQDLNES